MPTIVREIFTIPSLGKPNKTGQGYVVQKAQQGNTCVNQVQHFIRARKGEVRTNEQELLEIERRLGKVRKFAQLELGSGIIEAIKCVQQSLKDLGQGHQQISKELFLSNLTNVLKELLKNEPNLNELISSITSFLNHFNDVNKDNSATNISFITKLLTYIEEYPADLCKHHIEAMDNFNWESKYIELKDKYPETYTDISYEAFSNSKDKNKFHAFVKAAFDMHSAELYGLKESSWNPTLGFNGLFKSLSESGPHTVAGFYSKKSHEKPPILLDYTIKGHPVYAWSQEKFNFNSFTNKSNFARGHAVLVVGLQEVMVNGKLQQFVYYRDPVDASDPNAEKNNTPLYVDFLDNFISRMSTTDGIASRKLLNSLNGFMFFSPHYKDKIKDFSPPLVLQMEKKLKAVHGYPKLLLQEEQSDSFKCASIMCRA